MDIQIETTDSNTSKLTVAKDRVILKFGKDIDNINKARMKKLAEKVVTKLYNPNMLTRRGKFFYHASDLHTITMYIQTRKSNTVDPITFAEG
jgi:hypothetical protein